MLLRSVMRHVKDQNWFAVGIDFLIVVVGVFIGIQVSNWNAALNDRAREHEYYLQILKDLRKDLMMARVVAHDARLFDQHGDYLAEALADPDFTIEDPDYVALSIARAGYVRFPVINRHTINELESVGGLILLRDQRIKGAILDYYDAVSNTGQWNELLRAQQLMYKNAHLGLLSRETERQIAIRISTFDNDFRTWQDEKAGLGPDGLGVDLSMAEDMLRRARARPDFPGALAIMEVVHSRLELRAGLIERQAAALISIIEQHIGATPH